MTSTDRRIGRIPLWLFGILLLAVVVRFYHINGPLDDEHCFRQTQTAGLIRDYFRDGIELGFPRMITLGDPGYVVLEFPAYQAIAAVLYRLFSPDILYARFLSICLGAVSILFVYRLARRFLDERTSLCAAFFYAFMPLNIFFQRVPMPDTLAVMLSLVMLDFLMEGIEGNAALLLGGMIAAAVGIVVKPPAVAPLYLPLFYFALTVAKPRRTALRRFFVAAAIPLLVMAVWQAHANAVNDTFFSPSAYPANYLHSSVVVRLNPLNTWYFGTLDQRLTAATYMKIMEYISLHLFARVGWLFFVAGFAVLAVRRWGGLYFVWLASLWITIMIFFNLYVVHNYYHLFMAPVLSMFCAVGLSFLSDLLGRSEGLRRGLTALFLLCFFIPGVIDAKDTLFHKVTDLVGVGDFIDQHVPKGTMIATSSPVQDYWDPTLMYYADRRGFNVPQASLNKEMLSYLKAQGIGAVAVVDGKNAVMPGLEGARIVAEDQRVKIYDIGSSP